jgi:acetyltransferase-like isoleucine patch superfamily enzyme
VTSITRYTTAIRDVKVGNDVKIVEPTNVYECSLGVMIGARTRVQSHSFICELVTVGEDCFIGHGVMFVNDRFASGGPARGDVTKWENTTIGNRVSIGSNATIMPVEICDDVVIGAGSVVTKSITKAGIYAGNPARFLRSNV